MSGQGQGSICLWVRILHVEGDRGSRFKTGRRSPWSSDARPPGMLAS